MTRTFNLADLFEVVAHTVPDRIAFVCGAQRLSYRTLDERATRLASALQAQGLRRGDHVASPCSIRRSTWRLFWPAAR